MPYMQLNRKIVTPTHDQKTMLCTVCYSVVRPSASGIELMELGGITPTSVTTAVILEGGVRS